MFRSKKLFAKTSFRKLFGIIYQNSRQIYPFTFGLKYYYLSNLYQFCSKAGEIKESSQYTENNQQSPRWIYGIFLNYENSHFFAPPQQKISESSQTTLGFFRYLSRLAYIASANKFLGIACAIAPGTRFSDVIDKISVLCKRPGADGISRLTKLNESIIS